MQVKDRGPRGHGGRPMKTLAIDTSLATGSVAALDGDRVAMRPLGAAGQHARLLAGALADVAAELGWRPRDAELVAVVRGPGSFTGLRVGVTTAKALAWATGARLVAVSGFEVVARLAGSGGGRTRPPIHVAYDAGRGDVFAATVLPSTTSPSGWDPGAGSLVPRADWIESLAPGGLVAGPVLDLEACAALLQARSDLVLAPPGGRAPTAAAAGAVALLHAAAGRHDDPFTLVPDYLRPSYAEEPRHAAGPRLSPGL
jgi:tRNA threonylcarbamoyladenosine biosynthesis protein TsaB